MMRRCTRRAAKPPKVMTPLHIQTPCLPSARRDLLRLLPPGGEDTEFLELPPPLPPQPRGPPRSAPCFFFLSFLSLLALFFWGCGCCLRGTVCKGLHPPFFLGLIHCHHWHRKSLWCVTLGIITFGGAVCLLFLFLGSVLSLAVCTFFCLPTLGVFCVHDSVWQCHLWGGSWH